MKLVLVILIQILVLNSYSENRRADSVPHRISEEKFVIINGIEQWVTVNGDTTKPVIVFLHGGPGSPLSPYAKAVFGNWEKDFVLVQWDQRGTGRTFGQSAPRELNRNFLRSNPLTIELMTQDGIQLVEYLKLRLKKEKVILFGSSWGSELGTMMTIRRPDLFYAYVAHAQIVNPSKDLVTAYENVYKKVEASMDHQSLAMLNAIGKPPYALARNAGQLLRVIKKYERANSVAPPASWFKLDSMYDNAKDNQDRENGDDYSFINYVGDSIVGLRSMMAGFNLFRDGLRFKIPVFFIQGKEDILTSMATTKSYFDRIKAPGKEFIVVPEAAHGFNQSILDTAYKVMVRVTGH